MFEEGRTQVETLLTLYVCFSIFTGLSMMFYEAEVVFVQVKIWAADGRDSTSLVVLTP